MPIAILDPFSGISGDMTLGALVDLGLSVEWLTSLPQRLGLDGVTAYVADVRRAGIACKKVEFAIPPQPHGRHLSHIRRVIEASGAPAEVQDRADAAFTAITAAEAAIHGTTMERVHLHEVGSVDAILDILGSIWGFTQLGVTRVYCGTLTLGDGFVAAAHGVLPVPAPATLKLLEGLRVRPGPDGAGELVTPTGAALVRALSSGFTPAEYTPIRSGFGAGTKDPADRPNALRIILAEESGVISRDAVSAADERVTVLAADIDDMSPEHLAAAADAARAAGALDVTCITVSMKKGRLGTRIEVLCRDEDAARFEALLFERTSTLGVRRTSMVRHVLARDVRTVEVLGHDVRVKFAALPDGRRRAKPEYEDVRSVAEATGRSLQDVSTLAHAATEKA
ncbi:MAG TPA: nickel pincer cofactor biosynthesis protein LarC [Gemmatimonadaceae bacterium]|nr:nickel pincer cofactor biosynthesis protein LarC [Gemmatimonadaceae bacterium]